MGVLNSMQKGFQSWFSKDNNASFLFVTAAIGWVLASLAQTTGVLINKELTKEEKRFLVPQEIADGAANIGMYALVTTRLMKKAVDLCKPSAGNKAPFITLKDAAGNVLDYAANQAKYAKMGRNLETGAAILGGIISTSILTPIARNAFGAYMQHKADKKGVETPARIKSEILNKRTQPYFTQTYSNTVKPVQKPAMVQPVSVYQNNGLTI